MTMIKMNKYSLMLFFLGIITFIGCKDDSEVIADKLTVTAITATGTAAGESVTKDLNGATASENVPEDAVITIEFSSDVEASTATTSSITLNDGTNDAAITVSTTLKTVKITPSANLKANTTYTLVLSNALTSSAGGEFVAITRTFKTALGIFVEDVNLENVIPDKAANQVAYWQFNGDALDALEMQTTAFNQITFGTNRYGETEKAASFNGNGDMVEIAFDESLITPNQTLTVWYKVNASDYAGSRFMFGLAAERGYFNEVGGELAWFKYATSHTVGTNPSNNGPFATNWSDPNGDGATDSQILVEYSGSLSSLVNGKWVMLAMTIDAGGMKTIYIDGEIIMQIDINNNADYPLEGLALNDVSAVGLNTNLGIGWAGSRTNTATGWANYETDKNNNRTFKGLLDDFRIFDAALTGAEVKNLYNAEKP